MFLDGRESSKFKLFGEKLKTMCAVTNINTVVTAIKDYCHQSVQALTTELKISWELYMYTTRPPFAYCSQELMFDKDWYYSCYETNSISTSI